jgi:hypothetical protein
MIRKPKPTKDEIYFTPTAAKTKLHREVSTGTIKGKYYSNSEFGVKIHSSNGDSQSSSQSGWKDSQKPSNYASAGSNSRIISDTSETRRPFKSAESSKFSDNLFYSFRQNYTDKPNDSTLQKTPNDKVCCGLFERDDGDFDDSMWSFLNPYNVLEDNFCNSKILVLIYAFFCMAVLILFMFFYNVISRFISI